MDKEVSPQNRSTISLAANLLMAMPINQVPRNDIIHKSYSEDKISKGGNEDRFEST